MKFRETEIAGVYLIHPEVLNDERGEFFRTFDEKLFAEIGLTKRFVQHNQSISFTKGTWRGLHYQIPPFTETKLIQCVSGKIFDVVLDIRKNSKTFMHWFGVELSSENKLQIIIPDGFAHGFITMKDNSILIYHHSQFYEPKAEAGIRFDEPKINLILPLDILKISERDKSYAFLTDEFKGIEL